MFVLGHTLGASCTILITNSNMKEFSSNLSNNNTNSRFNIVAMVMRTFAPSSIDYDRDGRDLVTSFLSKLFFLFTSLCHQIHQLFFPPSTYATFSIYEVLWGHYWNSQCGCFMQFGIPPTCRHLTPNCCKIGFPP